MKLNIYITLVGRASFGHLLNKVKLFDCFDYFIDFGANFIISITDKYMNWTDSLKYCKQNDDYLFGNIDLSNVSSSCTGFNHTSQRWIGVVKEDFLSTDDGKCIYSKVFS